MADLTEIPTGKFEIELLGRFRIAGPDGVAVEITSRRGRALIAYLATHLDQMVPRSRIAGLLWEERSERSGRHNLRQVLTELRDALGDDLDGASKDSVRLSSTRFAVDLVRFIQLGRSGTLFDLETAAALYKGDLTTDVEIETEVFEDWFSAERRRLHAIALEVFDACVRGLEADNRQAAALALCERLLALDPIREATHRLLIGLEASVNGRSSALNRAEQLAKELHEQVGVSPEPATLELVASLAANGRTAETNANFMHVAAADPADGPAFGDATPPRRRMKVAAAFGAAALVAALVWYGSTLDFRSASEEDKAGLHKEDVTYQLAVLPFELRTNDKRLQSFMMSLEQDLVDSISHVPRFLSISYQTSRSYRGTQKDAREIGKELGVDYLLTGNANIDGDDIAMRTQLVDARNGWIVSSELYTHKINSSYEVFDEIVLGVSRKLQVEAILSEGLRRSIGEERDPTFGDLIRRGKAESIQSFLKKGSADRALELFEEALKRHPDSVAAKIGVASVLLRLAAEFQSANPERDLRRADELLTTAVRDNGDWSSPHYFLGILRKLQGQFSESVTAFEKALKLNPSLATAHAQLGHSLIFMGRAEEAGAHIRKAIRLSSRDPLISAWYLFAGQAYLYLGQDQEAIEWLERSVEAYSHSARTHVFLAAAYALNGDEEKAAAAARTVTDKLPNFSAKSLLRQGGGYAEGKFIEQRARVIKGIQSAIALSKLQ